MNYFLHKVFIENSGYTLFNVHSTVQYTIIIKLLYKMDFSSIVVKKKFILQIEIFKFLSIFFLHSWKNLATWLWISFLEIVCNTQSLRFFSEDLRSLYRVGNWNWHPLFYIMYIVLFSSNVCIDIWYYLNYIKFIQFLTYPVENILQQIIYFSFLIVFPKNIGISTTGCHLIMVD